MLLRQHAPFWAFFAISVGVVFLANALIASKLQPSQKCTCGPCKREIVHKDIDQITFISVLEPGSPQLHKVAIASWLSVSDKSRVLLFADRDSLGTVADELDELFGPRIRYVGPAKHDFENIAYVDAWFRDGVRLAKSQFVCLICDDIVLGNDWMSRAVKVFNAMSGRTFLLVGPSGSVEFDVNRIGQLPFGKRQDFLNEIDSSRSGDSQTSQARWFAFRTDEIPFDPDMVPPFLISFPGWSEWMIGFANAVTETVSFGSSPASYQIVRDKEMVEGAESRLAVNENTKVSNKNYTGSCDDTTWEVVGDHLVRRMGQDKINLETIP